MHQIRLSRLTQATLGILAALLSHGALAAGEPAPHAGPGPAQRPGSAQKSCLDTIQTVPSTLSTREGAAGLVRMADTGAEAPAGLATWPAHLRTVLLGSGQADVDGFTSPCRLRNGDIDTDRFKNDGGNAGDLPTVSDMVQLDKMRAPEDDDAALAAFKRRAQIVEQVASNTLPVGFAGAAKKPPVAPGFQDAIEGLEGHHAPALAGRAPYDEPEQAYRTRIPAGRSGQGGGDAGGPGGGGSGGGGPSGGSVPEVPEPGRYLTLLSGLAALGILARLKKPRRR